MNKIASALIQLKENEGHYGAQTLGIYKKAAASVALNEVYPRIADKIVKGFYKQACSHDDEDTMLQTILFTRGLTKVAGTDFYTKNETMIKLATAAIEYNKTGEHTPEKDLACYSLVMDLIK